MRVIAILGCVLGIGVLQAASAQALSVTNLDSIPREVTINNSGEVRSVTIAPNATHRTASGYITLTAPGQPLYTEVPYENSEYTIWPGGRLGLQRRNPRQGGQVW